MSARYPSITLEGGLIAADVLASIADGSASGQKPRDFGLPDGTSLLDQISTAWSDARAYWSAFERQVAQLKEGETGTSFTRTRWVLPFLAALGYEHVTLYDKAPEIDGLSFAVSHRAGTEADAPPIHIIGAGQSLDKRAESGRPRLAPHSLVQEYLNRTEHLWGLVTNGLTLRLLRDSQLIRRQAYIEVDLQSMFAGEGRFADFALLYRLLHRTRFPQTQADGKSCLLERWFQTTVEQGGRVREKLRTGVENAIPQIANGMLRHPKNAALLDAIKTGELKAKTLYEELLRLIYRLLFLMVTEERNLLTTNATYRERYSISRLRRLCENRHARNSHVDLWTGLQSTFQLFHIEDLGKILDVPPLNGELFDLNRTEHLNDSVMSNRDFLDAFWHLSMYREDAGGPPRHINYSALDVEELGSVYEGLLELQPTWDEVEGRIVFSLIPGLERKGTGSYYTPPELVEELLKTALLPLMQGRLQGSASAIEREKRLLAITICDPACGSGHFLLAAARRLARELAKVRSGEDEPSPKQYRAALRDVIAHCIYGVDKNPLAVELCKVALWLESYTESKPLSFVDHRIQVGNSLVGIREVDLLKAGIPEDAYKPVTGDDKLVAKEARSSNRRQLEALQDQQLRMIPANQNIRQLGDAWRDLDAVPDNTPEQVRAKRKKLADLRSNPAYVREHEAADVWTFAFFARLTPENVRHGIPLTNHVLELAENRNPDPRLVAEATVESNRLAFFHWPLRFPEVFSRGGFDVLLEQLPWEMLQLEEQQFFAGRKLEIAMAPNASARKRLIQALPARDPALWSEYDAAMHDMDCLRKYVRASGQYPLTSGGRNNTYSLFAERLTILVSPSGRLGAVLPTGIATDDTNKAFFADIATSGRLVSLFDFENRDAIFPAVHRSYKFCLLTVAGTPPAMAEPAQFAFFLTQADQLQDSQRIFPLTAEDFTLLNPNTKTCPIFRTRADAELTRKIYHRIPVMINETKHENPWGLSFKQGLFNMASDSHLFRTSAQLTAEGYRLEGNVFVSPFDRYLPLYEAKMIHQFDHRWCTYVNREQTADLTMDEKVDHSFVVQPRYWVREQIVDSAVPHFPEQLYNALASGEDESVRRILRLWAGGDAVSRGEASETDQMFVSTEVAERDDKIDSVPSSSEITKWASDLARQFPLTAQDKEAIIYGPPDALISLAKDLVDRHSPKWLMGWRDICRSTDERTIIASCLPKTAVGHTFLLMFPRVANKGVLPLLIANLNTFVCDYVARQKIGGTHANYHVIRQLAVLPPDIYEAPQPWQSPGTTFGKWVLQRSLELSFTSSDLGALAADCGWTGAPFDWDEERRALLRAELDAAFLHAYEIERRDAEYILSAVNFPIVAANRPEVFGQIMLIYDRMADASRTGKPFSSQMIFPASKVEI